MGGEMLRVDVFGQQGLNEPAGTDYPVEYQESDFVRIQNRLARENIVAVWTGK